MPQIFWVLDHFYTLESWSYCTSSQTGTVSNCSIVSRKGGGEGGRNTFIHFILRKPWFTPGLLLASSNHSLCECACTGFYIEQLIHALGCIFELWCMWEVLRVWMKHLQQFLNYSRCSWEQLLTRFLVAFETFQVYHNLMMHS